MVQSAWEVDNFDRTDGALGDLKAGYVCEGSCFISRTYLRMNTSQLAGKKINAAYLHLDTVQAFHCGGAATATELWSSSWFDQPTTWGNQKHWRTHQGSGSSCKGGGLDLNAMQAMEEAAAGGWAETPIMLKGSDETNNTSWRRFGLDPYLVVDYNSYPNPPRELGIEGWGPNGGDAIPCRTGEGREYVGKATPRLRARISDPDGGMMDAGFRLYRGAGTASKLSEHYVGGIPSGSFAEVTLPQQADGIYTWNLWSGDYQLASESANCEMVIDTLAPIIPVITSQEYPAERDAGGVGVRGLFKFSLPEGGLPQRKDVKYYLYGFSSKDGDDPQTRATPSQLGGAATVSWVPMVSGPQYLSVRTVDRAGNRSPIIRYRIDVADYQVGISGKVAQWSFEDSLAETSGVKSLTYAGSPPPGGIYDTGHQGRGVSLGQDNEGHYQGRDALVRTDNGFTVSAWVKPAEENRNLTVLSQDGDIESGTKLYYDSSVQRWVFSLRINDTTEVKAQSAQPPAYDEWSHLAAVYDAVARKARIYVNGVLSGESDVLITPRNATGPFVVGAAKVNKERGELFHGLIDTVRTHTVALTGADITALHAGTSNFAPTAEYLFEDNLLNSGINFDLTAGTAPGYRTGYSGKAMAYDQPTGERPTARPVVAVTDSFSVGAWVRLNDKNGHYAIASQDGERTSGFILRYARDTDRWSFGLAAKDDDTNSMLWAIGTSVPTAGEWVHITGVHDTASHKIFLYVNGVKEAEKAVDAAVTTTGPFVIGASKRLGARADLVNGLLDEVNVYDGALTAEEVGRLMNTPVERGRYKLDETSGTMVHNSAGSRPATAFGPGLGWAESGGFPAATFNGGYVDHMGTVAGGPPVARWTFDNTLNDASGNGRNLTYQNGPATYVDGRHGRVVNVNGVNQYMTTAAPVVDTAKSYSVSAWVTVTKLDQSFTIASQDGNVNTPFRLMYNNTTSSWVFSMTQGDQASAQAVSVSAKNGVPSLNISTHLLGVYDATAGKVRLYVNGYLQGETAATTAWGSSGPFALGRAKWNGALTHYLPGTIDEVRVYDRVLTDSDAYGLWNLGSDIVAPFDPMFRTDKSYTISAWVRPDQYTTLPVQAFSFGTTEKHSQLMVGYVAEYRRWGLRIDIASTAAANHKQILSDNEAQTYSDANGWVHIAVTYDQVARKAGLYINGIPQSSVPDDRGGVIKVDPKNPPASYAGVNTTVLKQGRDLLIGRMTWDGLPNVFWKGAIRDVRVFTGVLPEACDYDAPVCLSNPAV